jgi:nucleotidyltransferase/DNA polymerase involved in DNA repair
MDKPLTDEHMFRIIGLLTDYLLEALRMKIACVFISQFMSKAQRYAKDTGTLGKRPSSMNRTPETSRAPARNASRNAVPGDMNAIMFDSEVPYYREMNDKFIDTLLRRSDRVESVALGCAYVRIDGLEAMHGGEAHVVTALLNCLPPGFSPQIGVGPSKFPAFVAAMKGKEGQASYVPDDLSSFLKPCSVNLLPVSPETKAQLGRLGFHTLGELAALTPHELEGRFGSEGRRVWELSNGIDSSPFMPIKPRETVTEHVEFPDWAITKDFFMFALDTLTRRAFSRPQLRNRLISRATVECSLYGSSGWARVIDMKEPVDSAERLFAALRANIDITQIPGLPLDAFLTLSEFRDETGTATGFFEDSRDQALRARRIRFAEETLRAKTGRDFVLGHVSEVAPDHPLPELRSVLMPVDASRHASIQPLKQPVPIIMIEGKSHAPKAMIQNKKTVEIAIVRDLWKIRMWWLQKPIDRTYYVLERADGRVITVFRDHVSGSWFQQAY